MQILKSLAIGALLLAFTNASPYGPNPSTSISNKTNIPTTVIAGVTVPDTPLVRAAQSFARAHNDEVTYNHVMRSWLFGSLIISHTPLLTQTIDPETHAIAALLHDLGLDNTGALISPDKRFEVDGAIAAREFIHSAIQNGTAQHDHWDEHRIQLVWDTIALHTTPSFFPYKEPVVNFTATGIFADFQGPLSDLSGTLTWEEFYRVGDAFPRLDLGASFGKWACGFARSKPATTYDNWMMQYGVRYVENYTEDAKGHLGIDIVEGALP
ncbi:metal dependent phosphohydrolase protein [Rutstroemia sp. NJR-2017a BBW]|nr:metal dependent phosphohydrolase protein [Rutstroemia sp. NJR-2017a BBW]